MKSDTVLDYAVFQLSPKRSRCELFVSSNGDTEKLASGLVKPFVSHLKVAEEQAARAVQSIKLEVERPRSNDSWFTKGTLERFVRFVSTPEILEMVNTFDAEMSQLEAARKIYSEGNEDHISGGLGGDGAMTAADATKKELLRAMDVRLAAVWQDLTAACARASAAGFNPDNVSELQLFSGCFGANRLNEACTRFISQCQRRPDLISPWKPSVEDQVVRSSWGSDMSIEDPVEEPSGSLIGPQQHSFQNKYQYPQASQGQQHQNLAQNQHYFSQPKTSTSEQSSSSLLGHQHRNQNENKEAEKKEEGAIELSSTNQPGQPARRLSVQDRINLFENKQKEISGGKPVVVGRSAELRRLSSDVSSGAEKSVLRRWSGTSDMSIDLGIEKKDINGMDSPLCTASLSSLSQSRSNAFAGSLDDSKDQKGLRDAASSATIEPKDVFAVKGQDELQAYTGGFGAKDEEVELKGKNNRKDQSEHRGQRKSFIGRGELVGLADQSATEEKLKGTLGLEERTLGTRDLGISEEKSSGLQDTVESVARKNRPRLQSQIGSSVGKVADAQLGLRVEDIEVRDQLLNKMKLKGSQSHTRSLSEQLESGFGMKVKERSAKEIQGDQSVSSLEWRLSTGEVERDGRKDSVLSGKEAMKVDDLPVPKMKVQNSISTGAQQRRKMQGRREEIGSVLGTNNAAFPNKKSSESRESFGSSQTPSMEQTQRVRLSKGSQELNHELKIKANELEKLFAEHKLRVPGDQSNSTRKQATNSQYRKSATTEISPVQVLDKETVIEPIVSDNDISEFNTPQKKTANYQEFGNSLKKNISQFSFSDDSRGKFYEKYVQKRDAKLREEWGTKRAEKEAKLKAMQDSLERSRAEMKASLSASADKKESVTSTRRRSDHFRKFNLRSSMKKEQQPVDSTQSEEDEEPSELSEEKCCGQDRSFSEVSFVDGSSKSSQNKKPLPNRKSSSSTPRSTAVPLPRSSAKLSYSNSGRRRGQSENPLAQSVPNFSDLRKENTKPTSGVSKTGNRTQTRTYSRSKSTSEEMPHAKEEKHRHSESLRKSTANPGELKDLSPDGVILAPLKFDEEQIEEGFYEKSSKNVELKPFLRKDDASVAKQRASVVSETLTHGEEFESPMELDDSIDVATREKEGFETTEVEDSANANNGKVSLSQDFDKIGLSGSENGDSLRSLTHIDPSLVVEMPSSVPSTYHAQDSAGESPVSWNSQMHQVFTYLHETSDIDASLDSPTGSPASWNSHSLSQAEADGAQMRKKWGSSQKPILVAHSSHNQSRKDVTKGFKRLLKFGRKSRGTDNLVDWISATTSEGDDDTEDGRDPANRSSEDLRKSRMGFSQGHPSDDSFNESELFNEHVQALHSSIPAPPVNFKLRDDHVSGSSIKAPRSFFSLSSFRSKGGDSKLR